MWHGYVGILLSNVTEPQRAMLIAAIHELGPGSNGNNAHIRHWRVRLDGQAAIGEAAFPDNIADIPTVKAWFGRVFGVDPMQISHAVQQTDYGPLVTFTYNALARLKLIAFGGVGASWAESNAAVLAYLKNNAPQWENV
jgi:hypothetical protein